MAKKTLKVEELKNTINNSLANSVTGQEFRRGLIFVLEDVLFATGNYGGFKYLLQNDVPEGELPGVRYDLHGNILPYEQRFKDTDDTRRHYF